jgi:hypothetical protein
MRRERGTFCLQEETLERLRAFSQKTGVPQSQVVDGLLTEGLEHLQRHWPVDVAGHEDVIRGIFANGKNRTGRRKSAKGRRKAKKVSFA